MEKLVRDNWDSYVVTPYQHWDTNKLNDHLSLKGHKGSSSNDRDSLVLQVQDAWYETEDTAQNAWLNSKDWILDSWTESQLKAFCDRHGIPVPQPRKRDTLLEKACSSLQTVAKKVGDTASYPGNWLYDTWTGLSPFFFFPFLLVTMPPLFLKTISIFVANPCETESDLKEWLDTYGFPAPQPSGVRPPYYPPNYIFGHMKLTTFLSVHGSVTN